METLPPGSLNIKGEGNKEAYVQTQALSHRDRRSLKRAQHLTGEAIVEFAVLQDDLTIDY